MGLNLHPMKYANEVQLTAGKESVLGVFLVRMWENTNLKISKYEHFSLSDIQRNTQSPVKYIKWNVLRK